MNFTSLSRKILFEISQVLTNTAIRKIKYSYAMARSLYKLPVRTKVVYLKY